MSRIQTLSQLGFDHVVVPLACFVIFAFIGTFYLVSSHANAWSGELRAYSATSKYCLTANGSATGDSVVLDPCSTTRDNNQIWTLNDTRTATVNSESSVQEFDLKSAAGSNECLDNWGASTKASYPEKLYPCSTSDSALTWMWGVKFTSRGYSMHQLATLSAPSLCLDDQSDSDAANTKVGIYSCKTTSQSNQEWFEAAAPSGSGSGSSGSGGAVTDLYSPNWSGYVATSGSFTSVSGSWNATDPGSDGASDSVDGTWIGIGGWVNHGNNLIQVGTYNDVSSNGQITPGAFYELVNSSATDTSINMTISPGDAMTAKVSEISTGMWQIVLTDVTRNEKFTKNVLYNSALSTAEWIEEDPFNSGSNTALSPFDDYKSVKITGATTTRNGTLQTLKNAGSQPVIMQNSSHKSISVPSAIGTDGESFTVTGGG